MLRRVLVIDDEPDVSRSLQDLLGFVPDCEVEVAGSYAEGKAKALAGPWDVIISDERMPDGRGVDLLAEVARAQPESYRVLMSAFSDFEVMMRAVNVGHIHFFIRKPWDPEAVMDWVGRALREDSRVPPMRHSPFRRIGTTPS